MDFYKKNSIDNLLTKLKRDNLKINHLINCARSIKNLEVKKWFEDRSFLNEYLLSVVVPYELSIKLVLFSLNI